MRNFAPNWKPHLWISCFTNFPNAILSPSNASIAKTRAASFAPSKSFASPANHSPNSAPIGSHPQLSTLNPQPSSACNVRLPTLHARINARVDEMFARGLVEETRALLNRGLEQNKTALQAIGYRQVVEHLRGERPLAETVELVKSKTRQFAKRQMTWFRRQLSVEWISVKAHDDVHSLAERIAPSET